MIDDEQRALRELTTARLRRNYRLCEAQLALIHDRGAPAHLAPAAAKLLAWSASYLDELVRRGVRA